METPKVQAARWTRALQDIPADEVEEFDATVQNARKMLDILVGPAMPCVTQVRVPTPRHRRRMLQCQKKAGGDPSIELRATLSDKKRKGNGSVRIFEGVFLTEEGDHSHEDFAADRGFYSWHHCNLAHVPVPISESYDNSDSKDCSGHSGQITTCQRGVRYK